MAKDRFVFEQGKYHFTLPTKVFESALDEFVDKVISKIDGHAAYAFLVRGVADAREFKAPLPAADHQDVRTVEYLPEATPDGGRYYGKPHKQTIKDFLRNAELPNVRAEVVARLIRERLRARDGERAVGK